MLLCPDHLYMNQLEGIFKMITYDPLATIWLLLIFGVVSPFILNACMLPLCYKSLYYIITRFKILARVGLSVF